MHLYPLFYLHFSFSLFKSSSICSLNNMPVFCIHIFISFICVCLLVEFIQAFVSSLLFLIYLFIIFIPLHLRFCLIHSHWRKLIYRSHVAWICHVSVSLYLYISIYSQIIWVFYPSSSLHEYICNIHKGVLGCSRVGLRYFFPQVDWCLGNRTKIPESRILFAKTFSVKK